MRRHYALIYDRFTKPVAHIFRLLIPAQKSKMALSGHNAPMLFARELMRILHTSDCTAELTVKPAEHQAF